MRSCVVAAGWSPRRTAACATDRPPPTRPPRAARGPPACADDAPVGRASAMSTTRPGRRGGGRRDQAAAQSHRGRRARQAPRRAAVAAALDAVLGGLRRLTVKTPAPPPIPDELDRLLRRLRMPTCARRTRGDRDRCLAALEPAEILRVVLTEEAAGRDQATIAMRRRASGPPAGKTFHAWDENASPIPALQAPCPRAPSPPTGRRRPFGTG